MIELSTEGNDYAALDASAAPDEAMEQGLVIVHEVLARAQQQLTRKKLLEHWPERRKPNDATLWRWLDRAVQRGQIMTAGEGRRGEPLRYFLPGTKVP